MTDLRALNPLEEAKYAIKAGDWKRAEMLLAEACTLAAFERRLQEAAG